MRPHNICPAMIYTTYTVINLARDVAPFSSLSPFISIPTPLHSRALPQTPRSQALARQGPSPTVALQTCTPYLARVDSGLWNASILATPTSSSHGSRRRLSTYVCNVECLWEFMQLVLYARAARQILVHLSVAQMRLRSRTGVVGRVAGNGRSGG